MGKRMIRVNELLMREVSDIIHTDYRSESVFITITEVHTSPDLKNATVFYSVLGQEENILKARSLFKRIASDIRFKVGKRIILKSIPFFSYKHDTSIERGIDVINLMEDIDQSEGKQ